MTRRLGWLAGALVAAGLATWAWLRAGGEENAPWGAVWAEALGDGKVVVVWAGDGRARVSRVRLDDGRAERTIEQEGELEVLAATPGVLWVRGEGGVLAIELPALVRHRVEGTLRSDPRTANYVRAVGALVDRLVLVNERGERYAVAADGSIERVQDDAAVTPAQDPGELRTPLSDVGPFEGLRAEDLPLPRAALVTEAGRPVVMGDAALVVGRTGSGPSEAHELAAVTPDGNVRWRAPALPSGGRVVWADGEHLIAVAPRLVTPEGGGEARWRYRTERVRLDPRRGPIERRRLTPGEP